MSKKIELMLFIFTLTLSITFFFQNYIIAYFQGVDVNYINDPLYCEENSDCNAYGIW